MARMSQPDVSGNVDKSECPASRITCGLLHVQIAAFSENRPAGLSNSGSIVKWQQTLMSQRLNNKIAPQKSPRLNIKAIAQM